MTPEQQERISDLFEAALGLESSEREAFIKGTCDDEEVVTEVRSLLAEHARAGNFLERPLLGPMSDERPEPFTSPGSTPTQFALREISRRYEILGEIGRGGMGIVYKARDRVTSEIVALKLLKPEIAADQAAIERFKTEMRLARKITHKNVCRIYEFNPADRSAYISMEFVDGESLRNVINRFGGLPVGKGTQIARQVCAALGEAHNQGTVHRDLKPENIMIDASGNAKIMDFGIARSVETGVSHGTLVIGTPSYMAPEQAEGKSVDGRADIYALGLILYEVLTGKPAFTGDTPISIALKQISEAPLPPHEIAPFISPRLEALILRCLAKNPEERFQSVGELEGALDETTESTGTTSRLPRSDRTSAVVSRGWNHWSRRLTILIPAFLVCLVIGFFLGKWKPGPSRMHHNDEVYEVSFSPDGKFLASASEDKTVKIWDLARRKEIRTWPDPKVVSSVVFSPDGRWLAFASGKTVKLWEWKTESTPFVVGKHANMVNSVAFSPDGHLVASGGDDKLRLWEADTHHEKFAESFGGDSDGVNVIAFSPDGKRLASGGEDQTVKLWDVNTGREIPFPSPAMQSDAIESLAFSPDGRWVAAGSADKTIKLWEVSSGIESAVLSGHEGWVTSLSFTPDSHTLASGSLDGSAKLWDVASRTLLRTFTTGDSGVQTVEFSPDGHTLALGTDNGNIEFRSVN